MQAAVTQVTDPACVWLTSYHLLANTWICILSYVLYILFTQFCKSSALLCQILLQKGGKLSPSFATSRFNSNGINMFQSCVLFMLWKLCEAVMLFSVVIAFFLSLLMRRHDCFKPISVMHSWVTVQFLSYIINLLYLSLAFVSKKDLHRVFLFFYSDRIYFKIKQCQK